MIIKKVYKGTTPFVKGYKGNIVIFEDGGLPSEYQQVEYIQSTSFVKNSNYIDTGIYVNIGTVVTATFEFYSSTWDWGRIFGDETGSSTNGMDLCGGGPSNMNFRYMSETAYYNFNINQIYKVDFGNNAAYVDDTLIDTFTATEWPSNPTLKLFSSNADRDGAFNLYGCQITQDGDLVRDYVPCYVKATGEVGLYDLVTQQFYHNLGSVPFTCYPAPQSTYTRIEYIESTGTQWIDTGIQPTLTSAMKFGINMSENCGDTIIGNCFAPNQDYTDWRIFNYGGSILWDCVQDRYWGGSFNPGTYYDFECGNNYCIQDGNTQYSGTTQSGTIDTFHILVFAQNGIFDNSLHPDYVNDMAYSAGKLYYLQIYDNGVLVRDFIPVRDGQIGGLYDRVSGQFFGNDGTGDFILGGDI